MLNMIEPNIIINPAYVDLYVPILSKINPSMNIMRESMVTPYARRNK